MRERSGPGAAGAATEAGDQVCRGRQPDITRDHVAPIGRGGGSLRALRRQRQVERIHRLGPRAISELLDEIARHNGIGEDIDRRLERYAAADREILHWIGGDKFPPNPIRMAPR
jgi:hypothetical protein